MRGGGEAQAMRAVDGGADRMSKEGRSEARATHHSLLIPHSPSLASPSSMTPVRTRIGGDSWDIRKVGFKQG